MKYVFSIALALVVMCAVKAQAQNGLPIDGVYHVTYEKIRGDSECQAGSTDITVKNKEFEIPWFAYITYQGFNFPYWRGSVSEDAQESPHFDSPRYGVIAESSLPMAGLIGGRGGTWKRRQAVRTSG